MRSRAKRWSLNRMGAQNSAAVSELTSRIVTPAVDLAGFDDRASVAVVGEDGGCVMQNVGSYRSMLVERAVSKAPVTIAEAADAAVGKHGAVRPLVACLRDVRQRSIVVAPAV